MKQLVAVLFCLLSLQLMSEPRIVTKIVLKGYTFTPLEHGVMLTGPSGKVSLVINRDGSFCPQFPDGYKSKDAFFTVEVVNGLLKEFVYLPAGFLILNDKLHVVPGIQVSKRSAADNARMNEVLAANVAQYYRIVMPIFFTWPEVGFPSTDSTLNYETSPALILQEDLTFKYGDDILQLQSGAEHKVRIVQKK